MAKATFSVKNFEQFQHYKDRNPIWIKLYNSLLEDYDFGLLPDASKAHLLAIWLLASRYKNEIPLDGAWVAKKINATSTVDLSLLEKAGFIQFNQQCSDLLASCYQLAIPEKRREREQVREETEKKVELAATPLPAKRKAKTSLPDGFPLEADLVWSHDLWISQDRLDLSAQDEIRKFRDHHSSNLKTSADWPASWRTWAQNALKFNHRSANGRSKPTPHENFAAGAVLAVEERARRRSNGN